MSTRKYFFILGVILLATMLYHWHTPLIGDVLGFTYAAERLLAGEQLYRDFGFDPNLPMATLLSLPPAIIGKVLGIAPYDFILKIYLIAIVGLEGTLTWLLVRHHKAHQKSLLTFLLFFLALASLGSGAMFGQRENLFVILATPYVFSVILIKKNLAIPRWSRFFTTLSLFTAIAIKPHFAMLWIFLELYIAWGQWRKMFRPENIAIGIALIGYIAMILIAFPDYLTILRLVNTTYSAWRSPFESEHYTVLAYTFLALLFFVIGALRKARHEFTTPFAIATVAAGVIALSQITTFFYHFFPLLIFSAATLVFELGAETTPLPWAKSTLARIVVIFMLLLPPLSITYRYQRGWHGVITDPSIRELVSIINQQSPQEHSFYMFTLADEIQYGVAAITDGHIGARLPSLWPMPELLKDRAETMPYTRTDHLQSAEQQVLDIVISDLTKSQPQLLFFVSMPDTFFMQYFMRDPRFTALMEEYEQIPVENSPFQAFRRR